MSKFMIKVLNGVCELSFVLSYHLHATNECGNYTVNCYEIPDYNNHF